jgi:signal transduction histidine kinase
MAVSQRSVRQLLLALVVAGIGLVLLVGVAAVVATFSSTRAVDSLSDRVNPAVTANTAVYEDMLNAQAAIRAFGASGDTSQLAVDRQAVRRLGRDGRPLATYGAAGSSVRRLHHDQMTAARAWIAGYARPRIASGGGPGTYDRKLFTRGVRLFHAVDSAHARLADRLDSEYDTAQDSAQARLRATIGLVAGSAVLGGLILALLGWWVLQRVRRPLTDLEDVVERLTAGEHEARVVPSGPPEIRSVGEALNELAALTDRGRQVEAAIQTRLREVDAAKTDFISNVSHELRTPLTTITGYLELLREGAVTRTEEDQLQMLDATIRNVFRLAGLIEDLLVLDRAEHSGTTLADLDLRTTVDEVVSDLRLAAANRSVALVASVPSGPVVTLADASQLHRALLNLVTNAVKFSDEGGRVEVTLTAAGDEAVITVRDRGMGIPAAELPRLGSRFFRASNAVRSEVGGTGLGLRIVQEIVTNHHGRLTVDSVEGEGTTVRLAMPLRPRPDEHGAGPGARVEPTSVEPVRVDQPREQPPAPRG